MTWIATAVDDRVSRRWRIDYAKRDGASRVERVRECTDDAGGEVCKPGTSFRYRDTDVFAERVREGPGGAVVVQLGQLPLRQSDRARRQRRWA
nr:hypothetical protein GCM10020092_033400 [Actinoplanes digitatis]